MKRILRKGNTDKGFTLAELLIVVAIIGVLVAIAIPTFSRQLENSREATDCANIRSAYADAMTEYVTHNPPVTVVSEFTFTVKQLDTTGWVNQGLDWEFLGGTAPTGLASGSTYAVTLTPPTSGSGNPTVAVTTSSNNG